VTLVITYRLTLESPVVLSIPGGDPNSAETLSYISGSAVAGALAGQCQPTDESGGMTIFQQLFLDESVRYLNAYPEGENNSRLLPPPLSLCTRKGYPDEIYDLAEPYSDCLIEEADDQGMAYQYQTWREGYIRFANGAVKHRSAQQTSAIHHQRDRKLGRAKEKQDPIFSYISLNSGERFIGKILMDDSTHSHLLVRLLENNPLYLGRSRSAQYGRAMASVISQEECFNFIEAGKDIDVVNPDSRLVVTLLSDYIGTDINGHPTPDAFIPELANRLGTVLATEMVSFVGMRPVSGYVNKWQMPRPVLPALQAGSVFVIQTGNTPSNHVHTLLWEGLGQRRAEGFGRLAFNWHGLENEDEECSACTHGQEELVDISGTPSPFPELNDMVILARKRLMEQDIDYKIVEKANNICGLLNNPSYYLPKRAFLGRLRGLIRTASTTQEIRYFIDNWEPLNQNLPYVIL